MLGNRLGYASWRQFRWPGMLAHLLAVGVAARVERFWTTPTRLDYSRYMLLLSSLLNRSVPLLSDPRFAQLPVLPPTLLDGIPN